MVSAAIFMDLKFRYFKVKIPLTNLVSAQCDFQPCGKILRIGKQSRCQGRKHGKGKNARNAILDQSRVADDGGRRYKVKEIMLSPVGIHMDMAFYEPDYEGSIFKDFEISLIMTDGTELPLPDGGGGGHWTEGDKKADVDYYAEFDTPIPRKDVKAIIICGTIYQLPTSD